MLLLILHYLFYILYFLYKYIGFRLVNHLFKKKLKKLSSKYENSSIYLHFNKNLDILIKNIYLDKFQNKNIKSVGIDRYRLLYYPEKNIAVHHVDNLKITVDESIENIDTMILSKIIYSKINNLEKYIEEGLNLTDRIINYILKNQKIIIKNVSIRFNSSTIKLNGVIIYKNLTNYKSSIKFIYFSTPLYNFIKIYNISIVYKKQVYLSVDTINIKIIENLEVLLGLIDNFKVLYDKYNKEEENPIIPIVSVNNIKISFKNFNNICLHVSGLNLVHTEYIKCTYLYVKNYKKIILKTDGVIYKFNKNSLFVDNVELNIYETTSHKIYLSLNKYIKKKTITKKHIDLLGEISSVLINSYIGKEKCRATHITNNTMMNDSVIEENLSDTEFPEDLSESFIVKKKNTNKLINSYIKKNYIKKTSLIIDKIQINLFNDNNIRSIWALKSIEYNVIINNEITITVDDLTIMNNNKLLIDNHNKQKKSLIIFYNNGKTEIQFGTLILNVEIDEFLSIYSIIEKNVYYINKLLCPSYSLNYIDNNFFIKHIVLQETNCIVNYFPKNCSYYKLFGNINEIYKNIDYKNISLKLIYVSNYYPYDFKELFKTILKEWLVDIKKNQIKNIIDSTKFNILINNTPLTITKNCIKSINKAISLLLSLL